MNDKTCFADVNLPFHVWVREPGAGGFRWVLREAAQGKTESSTPAGPVSAREPPRGAGPASP